MLAAKAALYVANLGIKIGNAIRKITYFFLFF